MQIALKKSDIIVCLLFVGIWIYCNIYNYAINDEIDIKPQEALRRLYLGHNENASFLINTPGCFIPNYIKKMKFKEAENTRSSCGERVIFIKKLSEEYIYFKIDTSKLRSKYPDKVRCCYQYIQRHTEHGKEDVRITYSKCVPFANGTIAPLKQDHINVVCLSYKEKKVTYEDSYMFVKKQKKNNSKPKNDDTWNVMVLGMDTMSRGRLYNSMPETAKYLQKQGWLDYRAYQKVAYNTFPNVMSLLTGKKLPTIYKACAAGMIACNDMLIWSEFRKAGYFTAYGEDFLSLPDTYANYKGFTVPPTDHYTRPFFLTGEFRRGNLVCTKTMPSAYHILNYAIDFSKTYKKEKSFGFFWLNSYTHNLDNLPSLIDREMITFFKKLDSMGSLDNTFIFFLSDHGIRFGETRVSVESYYEERLPMLFMWVPRKFREINSDYYFDLTLNQFRLATPYDLHATLWNILQMSDHSIEVPRGEACPNCPSLFSEISPHRTCADIDISSKWCTCYNLKSIDKNDARAKRSLNLAVSHIQNITKYIKTAECSYCSKLKLNKILRLHWYRDGNTKIHLVAFSMKPGNVRFEVNIEEDDKNNMKVLDPTHTISSYNTRGNCVKNPFQREYCVCDTHKSCRMKKGLKHYNFVLFIFVPIDSSIKVHNTRSRE